MVELVRENGALGLNCVNFVMVLKYLPDRTHAPKMYRAQYNLLIRQIIFALASQDSKWSN